MGKAITPQEVIRNNRSGNILWVFNYLIIQEWDGGKSTFLRQDAVNLLTTFFEGKVPVSGKETFLREGGPGIHTILTFYREAGWEAEYDEQLQLFTFKASNF